MTTLAPNQPPTPEAHIEAREAAYWKQSRRERSRNHKAAMFQRRLAAERKAKLEQQLDERAARRAFSHFLREMFGDARVWKSVRLRKDRQFAARRPRKTKTDSRSRLNLPSVGWDIVDRKDRRGVFLSIQYDGAKGNGRGVFRRRIEYAAFSEEVVKGLWGQPMLFSNVAATIDEAVAIADEIEAFSRAERVNSKLCYNLIIGYPRAAGPREREKIMRVFTQRAFANEGVPYVGFNHEPKRGGQVHNPHGHITASLRPVHREGPYRFLISKDLRVDLDGEEGMARLRKILAEVTTKVMREAGYEHYYTHLSNAARGLALIPQESLTKDQTEAAKRGEQVAANERNKLLVSDSRRHVFAALKAKVGAAPRLPRLRVTQPSVRIPTAVIPSLRRLVPQPLAHIVRRPPLRECVRIDLSKSRLQPLPLRPSRLYSSDAHVTPTSRRATPIKHLTPRRREISTIDFSERSVTSPPHPRLAKPEPERLNFGPLAGAALAHLTDRQTPLSLPNSSVYAVAQSRLRTVVSGAQTLPASKLVLPDRMSQASNLLSLSKVRDLRRVQPIPRPERIAEALPISGATFQKTMTLLPRIAMPTGLAPLSIRPIRLHTLPRLHVPSAPQTVPRASIGKIADETIIPPVARPLHAAPAVAIPRLVLLPSIPAKRDGIGFCFKTTLPQRAKLPFQCPALAASSGMPKIGRVSPMIRGPRVELAEVTSYAVSRYKPLRMPSTASSLPQVILGAKPAVRLATPLVLQPATFTSRSVSHPDFEHLRNRVETMRAALATRAGPERSPMDAVKEKQPEHEPAKASAPAPQISEIDLLHREFLMAKTDRDRRLAAASIRKNAAALKAINERGDPAWAEENRRFQQEQMAAARGSQFGR